MRLRTKLVANYKTHGNNIIEKRFLAYAHSGNKHDRQVEIPDNIHSQPTTPMWVREILDQKETKYFTQVR